MVAKTRIGDYLSSFGVKPSYQRIKIYEYLTHSTEFPSVDRIFHDLRSEITTLSKTTIYNTLKEFHKKRLLANIEEHRTAIMANSGDAVQVKCICELCGAKFDFDLNEESDENHLSEFYAVNDGVIMIKGRCKDH